MPYVESNRKVYYLGEPGSGLRPRGPIQEYPKLKEELIRKSELFKDPAFPANSESLVFKKESIFSTKQYSWKRPKELDNNPILANEGQFKFDSVESGTSECWLACAFIAFARNEKCFNWVVPRDQGFAEGYSGIFHFRLWAYGNWIDVVIDDRLPVSTSHTGETFLLNLAPRERIEFWQTLLVKAYAKLLGCYEAVYRSTTHEIMEDFTACITETMTMTDLDVTQDALINTITAGLDQGLYLIASSLGNEASQSLGLLKDHAYCIIDAKMVKAVEGSDQMVFLLKLYSPCKRNIWKGRYSRQYSNQETITAEVQLFLEKETKDICLSIEEFIANFASIELLHITPESPLYDGRTLLESVVLHGEWIRGGHSAGFKDSDLFWLNPQYEMELKTPDDKDAQCSVILQLTRKYRFVRRADVTNTFSIYKSAKRLTMVRTSEASPVARSIFVKSFLDTNKEILRGFWSHDRPLCSKKVRLPTGVYVIAPTTTKDAQEAEYYLRIVSKKKVVVRECNSNDEFYPVDQEVELLSTSGRSTGAHEKRVRNVQKAYVKTTREEIPLQWHQAEAMINSFLKSGIGSTALSMLQQKNYGLSGGLSSEIVRSTMAILDRNRVGIVDFPALKNFLDDLRFWKECFTDCSSEGNGMGPMQFSTAMLKSGFHLPSSTTKVILRRYSRSDGTMSFNSYIGAVMRARWALKKFNELRNKKGCLEFTLEDWFRFTLYS